MECSLRLGVLLAFVLNFGLAAYAAESEVTAEATTDGQEVDQDSTVPNWIHLNYYGTFFGPAVAHISAYQPSAVGTLDMNRPVVLKNFLALGFTVAPGLTVAPTAYWVWQPAISNQPFVLQDPFLRISADSIFHWGNLNLYADFRTHFPLTSYSKESGLRLGLQSVQALSYPIESTPWVLGLFVSERANIFNAGGFGNDFEFYLGPNFLIQAFEKVGFTFFYEFQFSHVKGFPGRFWKLEAATVEPGVTWDITPQLNVNPYLSIRTDSTVTLKSTAIGFLLSWTLL